jgi:hypothetical protein
VAEEEFNFEAEFALLDIGATSSMLRTGNVRPTLLAFTAEAGVEAIALDWDEEGGDPAVRKAFEEARRYARDLRPVAYALIVHFRLDSRELEPRYYLPGAPSTPTSDYLGLALMAEDGNARSVLYPVRRTGGNISFGMPTVVADQAMDWCPIGDLWGNPFCVGDLVRFRHRERAIDPATPLWQSIVELTRLRMHEDQANADEYMSFLDDLRNGIFVVAGRPDSDLGRVLLRPRTNFNPIGTLNVDASRLLLTDSQPAEVDKVSTDKVVA